MIRTPAQLKLMAQGLPPVPCNFGGESSSRSDSTNTTTTNTTTTYQDRRNVADGGSTVVSADQSSVFITNTDQGAINAGVTLGGKAMDAATVLTQAGADMLSKNVSLARDLASGSNSLTAQLWSGAQTMAAQSQAQSNAALQVVQSLAALPTKLNDPNRAIQLVGMSAIALAAVLMLRKG